ncbi:uncharacterized protein N7459_007026 [Penicillium hispanicum]|uniref:uncharacterized protein n=1 Tax=Penicillium hispanicum TaxID=1080232 RepID=UPI0025425C15|nr:uncharacterized protein N7459_007026 [Penicillium hispanicum]KAJ5578062.1 hypothetical protein N7459_007026 [Penicillium hispanicum]
MPTTLGLLQDPDVFLLPSDLISHPLTAPVSVSGLLSRCTDEDPATRPRMDRPAFTASSPSADASVAPTVRAAKANRCHRLKKQCLPSDSLRKRNLNENQKSASRISQLEGKLDGITSLLKSFAEVTNPSVFLRTAPTQEDSLGDGRRPEGNFSHDHPISATSAFNLHNTGFEGHARSNSRTRAPSPRGQANTHSPPSELTESDADARLGIFRFKMPRYFAFINFPSNLTAQKLQQ